MSKITYIICFLFFLTTVSQGQNKKEVKKNNIKATTIVDLENGKTLNNKKTVFDKNGETIEESDYDKDGALKTTKKYKYNKDNDVIEEEEFVAKTNKTEKRLYKYNALGEKTEEGDGW